MQIKRLDPIFAAVAWAERSETRIVIALSPPGFAPLNPGYEETLIEIRWVSFLTDRNTSPSL